MVERRRSKAMVKLKIIKVLKNCCLFKFLILNNKAVFYDDSAG